MVKPIRLFGKKISESELFEYIAKLIENGITSTSEISVKIGKDVRQVRRYLIKMSEAGRVKLDPDSGRVVKTTMQEAKDKMESIDLGKLLEYPEIRDWKKACESRVTAGTLQAYVSSLKQIFTLVPINPKWIVVSKKNAIEYWDSVTAANKLKTGRSKPSQPWRVAMKNLLDFHDISFGHKMGKKYNLGSEHDSYKKYAGVNTAKYYPVLFDAMREKNDFETILWCNLGLKTSARAGALASMTWERIYFENLDENDQPLFKMEIHETKVKKNEFHLGTEGHWISYYPKTELAEMLQEWKQSHPTFRRFVWFEDAGSDVANTKRVRAQQNKMGQKLAQYYEIIKPQLDPLTKEYLEKRPNHIMCHNFAQVCKDSGMSDEEIANVGHWDKKSGAQTISWYSSISSEKQKLLTQKVKELAL